MVPAVNQVEVHPYFGNEAVRAASAGHDIAVEAWSPIAQGDVLDDPTIEGIAASGSAARPPRSPCAGTSQRGDIVFPKSMKRRADGARTSRSSTSSSTADDMAAITALDRGEAGRHGPNPDTFDCIPDD